MADRAHPPPPPNNANPQHPAPPRQPNRPWRFNPIARPEQGQARGQQGEAPPIPDPQQRPEIVGETYFQRIIRLVNEALEIRQHQLANGQDPANLQNDPAALVVRMAMERLMREREELMAHPEPQGNNQDYIQMLRNGNSHDNKENNFFDAPPRY